MDTLHTSPQICYYSHKPSDKPWMKKEPRGPYNKWNIYVASCDTLLHHPCIKMMFGSSLPPVACLIDVICVCLRIVVSNTYCVVFFVSLRQKKRHNSFAPIVSICLIWKVRWRSWHLMRTVKERWETLPVLHTSTSFYQTVK
jgi:hypothetical protein